MSTIYNFQINIQKMPFVFEQEDSLFIPNQQKISRKRKNKFGKKRKFNCFMWNNLQNEKYIEFLLQHKQEIQHQQTRIKTKIFVQMSWFIKSRSPKQCRSHHQKMVKKYLNVQKIILNLFTSTKKILNIQKVSQDKAQIQEKQFQNDNQQKQKNVETSKPIGEMVSDDDLWTVVNQKVWMS